MEPVSDEDRLSGLPDDVIHKIFSYLDMSRVVQTSVLSRIWRNRWSSVPFLTFDQSISFKKFKKFVNLVFFFRNNSAIHTFRLILKKGECDPDDIDSWIRAAVHHRVQCLTFQFFPMEGSCDFPQTLFTSNYLTSLNLCLTNEELFPGTLELHEIPLGINLPSLKSLDLRFVTFMDGNFLVRLLQGCPALEKLVLVKCRSVSYGVLTISSIRLRYLKLELCYNDSVSKDEDLEIVVSAPNVVTFLWTDTLWTGCVVENLNAVEVAKIELHTGFFDQDGWSDVKRDTGYASTRDVYRMFKCLRSLYNVRSLTLSAFFLQVISGHPSELKKWATHFTNLKDLHLGTWLTRGCFCSIFFLLNHTPNIERLALQIYQIQGDAVNINEDVLSSLKIRLDHLQNIQFHGVTSSQVEFELVKVLLKSAIALKKIIFYLPKTWKESEEKLKLFAKRVKEITRGASTAVFFYLPPQEKK
ncbi:Fbd-associated f-box protein [Thalictrum thalictroides]|uniref:Fbd-associated f-box protein n=1 Tax=Thalictrum thalictroides TaxID=46969 RepID=A0A7J6VXP3_THATH|nr:Fbd-associated f-box protein [Thalictrum thalictroides]